MKDYKLKQRNLRASHTLGNTVFFFSLALAWAHAGSGTYEDVPGCTQGCVCSGGHV
jgi:hypothetical protein